NDRFGAVSDMPLVGRPAPSRTCRAMPRARLETIAPTEPIDVLFVIVPHSLLLDIAGPAEAFRLANQHREARGLSPRFQLRFARPAATLETSVGLSITELESLPERFDRPTWVVVVGQPTVHTRLATPAITATAQWLNDRLRESLDDPDAPHRLLT